MVRIAIIGAGGRMGLQLIAGVLEHPLCTLSTAICKTGSNICGMDAGILVGKSAIEILVTDNLATCIDQTDVIIDFTLPKVTLSLLAKYSSFKGGWVIGTTGFTSQDLQQISSYAQNMAIVLSPNMSPAVNLMFKLIKIATMAVGNNSDIEILEKHHRNKLDAPSGTALKIGEIIASTLNYSLPEHAVYGRLGAKKRNANDLGFSSIRAGDIVGEHTVFFASAGEVLQITHQATSRTHYVQGALQAALWLPKKTPGIYDMGDVLCI